MSRVVTQAMLALVFGLAEMASAQAVDDFNPQISEQFRAQYVRTLSRAGASISIARFSHNLETRPRVAMPGRRKCRSSRALKHWRNDRFESKRHRVGVAHLVAIRRQLPSEK